MCTTTFVDGHVPPKLPAHLTNAGFEIVQCGTVPMIRAGYLSTEPGESRGFIGNWAMQVVAEKAKKHHTDKDEVASFVAEMKERAEKGTFFGCVHRFLFLAVKPAAAKPRGWLW